jgi:hypothetical protein
LVKRPDQVLPERVNDADRAADRTVHLCQQRGRLRNAPPAQVQIDLWDQIDLSGTMDDAMRKVGGAVERRKIESASQIGFKVLAQKLKSYGIPEA